MTLVVTDVSRHGIVMVGDSAVTETDPSTMEPVASWGGAAKVHYSPELNLGITVWGYGHYGNVGSPPIDQWVSNAVASLDRRQDLESVGDRIVQDLNTIRNQEGLTGDPNTWGGFHLAGYLGGVPRLWHIHNGHLDEPVREFRLYRDYPDAQGWSDEEFLRGLEQGWWMHLRNGHIRAFARQFAILRAPKKGIPLRSWETSDTALAGENLTSRLTFYKAVIRRVADALSARLHPAVNNKLSAVAFNQRGLVVDNLLAAHPQKMKCPAGHMLGFQAAE